MDAKFKVGDWIVQPKRLCMYQPGKSVHIAPKSMAVLRCLADAGGDVVSRNDILDKVWPGAVVTDDVLTQCIVELRKAFDDSAHDPQFVETIPKMGFRLVAEVAEVESKPAGLGLAWRAAIATAVVLIIGIAGLWYFGQESRLPPTDANTLAVLPFVDLSPDDDQEFFADGLSEELTARLQRLDGLQVMGRASSFHYKGHDEDLQTIGQQLSVSHVLDGSVRRAGNELRVTAKLTDVSTGFHLWSNTYEREIEDIFAIQEEIAEAVATALSVGLEVGALGTIEGGTNNVVAYDEYLAGNAAYFGANPSITRAIQHYERATEVDPEFALAWAQLAQLRQEAFLAWGDSDADRFLQRRDEAIARAVQEAPESRQVLTTLAQIEIWRGKMREARRILEQIHQCDDCGSAGYSFAFVDLALETGRIGEQYRALINIRRLDPMNSRLPIFLAQHLLYMGQLDEALTELERAFERETFKSALANRGIVVSLAANRADEIRKWLSRASNSIAETSVGKNIFDLLLENLDDRDSMLIFLQDLYDWGPGNDYFIIIWASYFGDDKLALRSMRRSQIRWTFWSPLTARIRQTEEFKEIVIEAGLVDYWREFGWGSFCSPTEGDDFECH